MNRINGRESSKLSKTDFMLINLFKYDNLCKLMLQLTIIKKKTKHRRRFAPPFHFPFELLIGACQAATLLGKL